MNSKFYSLIYRIKNTEKIAVDIQVFKTNKQKLREYELHRKITSKRILDLRKAWRKYGRKPKVITSQGFGGYALHLWLKKNNFPDGFRVLCMNCNWAKSAFGICPHKKLKLMVGIHH